MLFRTIRIAAAAALLFCLSREDIRTRRLSDRKILLLAGISFLRILPYLRGPAVKEAAAVLLHMLAGGAGTLLLLLAAARLADLIFRTETLGGGDIKLAAALGLHLGMDGAVLMLLSACMLALAAALILHRRRRASFPFAPYLSAAALVLMLMRT